MNFAHPERLWFLLLVPPLAGWLVWGRRRRARDWAALGQGGRPPGDGSWGAVAAVGLLIVALAQPRWGRLPGSELPPGHDVVLLVDVSRSMGAEDALPDRLGAATRAAGSLLEALGREPGHRAAVVAFAGRGASRCALTEDLGAAAEALEALRPGEIRPGGTDLGAGLEAALDAFDDREPADGRTIVAFTDGEDHAGTWARLLPRLAASRIVVHAVAVGDPDHARPVPAVGGGTLTYRGQPVASRRDDAAPAAVARATGGAFLPMGVARLDLGPLYTERIAPVARRRMAPLRPAVRAERFPLPVLGAILAATAGVWPRSRRRMPRMTGAGFAMLVLVAAGSIPGESPAIAVAEGWRAYRAGDYGAARAAFERAITLDPRAAVPRYDAGSACFQTRAYAEAEAHYRAARERADARLRVTIDFARGNAALARGDIPGALRHYDACLASRVAGGAAAAIRRDALANRRFAEQLARDPTGGQGGEGQTGTSKPDGPRPPAPGAAKSAPGAASPTPDGGPPGSSPPSGARGAGGAGGSGPAPPRAGSPEARLADAVDRIRAARSRRLAAGPPPAADEDRKDW